MSIISKVVEGQYGTVTIYGIQTGRLAIKKSAMSSGKPGFWSTLLSFWDKEFGIWLPVWSWLIKHPEGIFLIDTGVSTEVNKEGYFNQLDRISRYYFERQMQFDITEKDEIGNQLETVGIACDSIDKVILTHLHIDHTGGLKCFPNTPIVVNEREWKTKDGSFPQLFPNYIQVDRIKLEQSFEHFEHSCFLTKSKDLIMVETSGHTRGHSSVLLKIDENQFIIFGGDVAYTEKRLNDQVFSATTKSKKESIKSCQVIDHFAKGKNILFLASHDSENEKRLEQFSL